MNKIPLVDLGAQFKTIGKEIKEAIDGVLFNCDFILGSEVVNFENEFANYCNVPFCVGVANGTDALTIALKSLDLNSNDEVITVPNTFIATVEAIENAGAKPVLCDIDPASGLITLENIFKVVTKKTKAIIVVHLMGSIPDMDSIKEYCNWTGFVLIEDSAQAHGATYKGKKAGSIGDIGCFSFYPGKNLGALGDGGAIVYNYKGLEDSCRKLRDHGRNSKYSHEIIGFNSRLDSIQAAVLRVKLKYLDQWNESRRRLADVYTKELSSFSSDIDFPIISKDCVPARHLYVIKTSKRDDLLKHLNASGIMARIHYPIPLHLQKALSKYRYRVGDFPNCEKWCNEILSLPLFPEMTESQQSYVIDCIKKVF